MERSTTLKAIREKLFQGSADYTKNQPDLFVPHRFRMLAPSQMGEFLEKLRGALADEPEVLLYVHLPFCFSECLFCNSFPQKTDKRAQEEYLERVLKEMDLLARSGVLEGKRARCVYFGGGTPTSFSNADLWRLLDRIGSVVELAEGSNVTTEAHPLTLWGSDRLRGLREIGIDRVSIGCQTFDGEILALCNRSNTEAQIARIVEEAQRVGLSINIDMMTGLPGQTMESVRRDLAILDRIRPDSVEYIRHEIVNPLVARLYEERKELVVGDDDLFEMVYTTQQWMSDSGYEQNGRFTDDTQWGYRYHWLKEMPIIAFGARTRSYTKTLCYDKHEELSTYSGIVARGDLPVGRYIELTAKEQMYRSLLLNLQLKAGLDKAEFRTRFGAASEEVFSGLLAELVGCGCVEQDEKAIWLTTYGAYFVEDVCDSIIDTVLRQESQGLARAPHSKGGTSVRLQ